MTVTRLRSYTRGLRSNRPANAGGSHNRDGRQALASKPGYFSRECSRPGSDARVIAFAHMLPSRSVASDDSFRARTRAASRDRFGDMRIG